jgi:hypothetical protein
MWEDNIRMGFRETIIWEVVGCIHLAQDGGQ